MPGGSYPFEKRREMLYRHGLFLKLGARLLVRIEQAQRTQGRYDHKGFDTPDDTPENGIKGLWQDQP